MTSACQFLLFFDPSRGRSDLRFRFHVFVGSNRSQKHGKGDVMFVLVSVFFMTLLSNPTTNPAINPPEFVTDDATVPELPKGFLQLPASVNFLLVES